jgi:Alpha/beta hydrolase family
VIDPPTDVPGRFEFDPPTSGRSNAHEVGACAEVAPMSDGDRDLLNTDEQEPIEEDQGARVGVRRVVVAFGSLVVVFLAAVTAWSGIVASHPSYLLVLVAILLVAVTVLAVWGGRVWQERRVPRGQRTVRTLVRTLLAATVLVVVGVVVLYFRPLPASGSATGLLTNTADVEVTETLTRIEFAPVDAATTGFVFYPGALVDARAYAPTLRPLAEAGYLVTVVKMPMGVAFFGGGAAGAVIAEHPEIEHWAIGGHSLGGAVASNFARDHRDEIDALVLWAAYPTGPMADAEGLVVLSVSASNDGLATPDDIEASVTDLPIGTQFVEVDGAVHAFFGDYGDQRGDGEATVSRRDAQTQIVDATATFLASISEPGA